jgi:hypothetical protein
MKQMEWYSVVTWGNGQTGIKKVYRTENEARAAISRMKSMEAEGKVKPPCVVRVVICKTKSEANQAHISDQRFPVAFYA